MLSRESARELHKDQAAWEEERDMQTQEAREFERQLRKDRAAWKKWDELVAECDRCPAGADCDSCPNIKELERFGSGY